MKLTKEEKAICKKFRKRDENNIVHCYECPLVISQRDCLCKANAEEWQGRYCIECVYSPHCTGAGVLKSACRGFEPVVRKDERWWRE